MEPLAAPLRVLLIGCGGITAAHLPAFELHPDKLRLVGACDPSAAARAGVAARLAPLGPVETFADHDEALARLAGSTDAALVVTPHFLHYPQARACVEAGLPVLVEKPICNNYAEALALQELATARGVLVMAGQTRRFDPAARALRDWVAGAEAPFGTLATFAIESWQNILCWIATKPDKAADFWILDKVRAGGGVVVSLSCHPLDLIRYLTGDDFAEASAWGVFEAPFRNGAESGCAAILRMKGGAVGTLNANYLARRIPYAEALKMYGSRGSIVSHATAWGAYSGELRHGTTEDDTPPGWSYQFEGLTPVPPVEVPGYGQNSFINQLLHFHACVTEGREPLSSLRRNLNTMAVIDAIYESMNAGGVTVKVKGT